MAITSIAVSKAQLTIGNACNSTGANPQLGMKNVAIYSGVMLPAIVTKLYNHGKDIDLRVASWYDESAQPGFNGGDLVRYFPLDDGKGEKVKDLSSVYDGRIINKVASSWALSGYAYDHTKGWRFFLSNESNDASSNFTSDLKLNFVQTRATTHSHWQTNAAVVPIGEWTQVGYSRASDVAAPIFYVNGVVVASTEQSPAGSGAAVTDEDLRLSIGNSSDTESHSQRLKTYSGALQELAVFNDARSLANMTSFYNSGNTHDLTLDADAGGAAMLEYWQVSPNVSPNMFISKVNTLHDLTNSYNNMDEIKSLYPIVDHFNIFDSTDKITDPSGWDGEGFADFTFFTNNSIVPAKGLNTIGIGAGLSLKTWQVAYAANSTTHSHNIVIVPPFFGSVYPLTTGSGYTSAKVQFWKIAFVYDGIQEGELSTLFVPDWEGDSVKDRTVTFYLNANSLSKRVTHVMFFRANSDTVSALEPDSFYRLVKSVRLDDLVDTVNDTTLGELKKISFTATDSSSATYDAMVGISETVFRTMPNYKLSTIASGSLFVANCYHAEAGGSLSEYMFKSKPYKYDQFDWTLDYITLPSTPTALEAYNGKVYAFTEDKTLRINPTSLYVEDEFLGAGCLNDASVISTEFGLFYFDKNNIYLHTGGIPEPIGHPILKSSNDIGFQEIMSNYDESVFKARTIFDGEKNAVMFVLSATKTWVYSIKRDRWDIWETADNAQIFFNETSDPWYISKGLDRGKFTNVFQTNNITGAVNSDIFINLPVAFKYGKDITRQRAFEWESKRMDMEIGSQEKFFYQIDTVFSGTSPTITYGTEGATPDVAGTVTKLTNHTKVKIGSGDKKKKDLKVKIAAAATSSTAVGNLSLSAHGILANWADATLTDMETGPYANIPTIDFDGSGGSGCTVSFIITNHGTTTGNIAVSAPVSNIVTFTTTNTHSFVAGDILYMRAPSDITYTGSYTVLASGLADKTFEAYQVAATSSSKVSTPFNVYRVGSIVAQDGGTGYSTGVYLPDTHTNTKRRLLIDPTALGIGNRARIFINIDTVATTVVDPTVVDAVGVIFRPPSKVKS